MNTPYVRQYVDDREARLGDGVVGGLLVGGERGRLDESRRHRAAVGTHVP